jgi:SagB-type dehydrogenase family enzyme
MAFSSETDSPLWELFHENSKLSKFSPTRSKTELLDWTRRLHESLPFDGYPAVSLPKRSPHAHMPLGKAIKGRASAHAIAPHPLGLDRLATLLRLTYGLNHDRPSADFIRSSRVVPSAGALYPLEIFVLSAQVEGLPPGLYHYNPPNDNLRLLQEGKHHHRIARYFLQPTIPRKAAALIFITAMFERTTFKYFSRGYRYVLLEAGHVAQNINLVSTALGLVCLNIGGFLDRGIDAFLRLDGVTHSTLYIIAIGGNNHGIRHRAKN